jgi:hypothetical protein
VRTVVAAVHEPGTGTGLPSRDVSFHGEFWRISGPNAGVLSTAALDPKRKSRSKDGLWGR